MAQSTLASHADPKNVCTEHTPFKPPRRSDTRQDGARGGTPTREGPLQTLATRGTMRNPAQYPPVQASTMENVLTLSTPLIWPLRICPHPPPALRQAPRRAMLLPAPPTHRYLSTADAEEIVTIR